MADSIKIDDTLTPKQQKAAMDLDNAVTNVAIFLQQIRPEIVPNDKGEHIIPRYLVKSMDEVLKAWTDASNAFHKSCTNPE